MTPIGIMMYSCPECGMLCHEYGAHQHVNGRWVDHKMLEQYWFNKRMDGFNEKIQTASSGNDTKGPGGVRGDIPADES